MHQDFKELLSAFNAGQVRDLIVGGYPVSFPNFRGITLAYERLRNSPSRIQNLTAIPASASP